MGEKEDNMTDINNLAKRLSYLKYPIKIKDEDIEFAKENGLVIVSGYSDDLCYLEGAICEEIGCFDGGSVYFKKNSKGEVVAYSEDDYSEEELGEFIKLNILWCEAGQPFTWSYKFDQRVPVATFEVYAGSEQYCQGIIFRVSDLLNK